MLHCVVPLIQFTSFLTSLRNNGGGGQVKLLHLLHGNRSGNSPKSMAVQISELEDRMFC